LEHGINKFKMYSST